MKFVADQMPAERVGFLVCSDEARNPAEFPGLNVRFAAASPVEDLYALAGCDYVMGPVSSFSQWSSFVGGTPLFQFRSADSQPRLDEFRVSYLGEIPK
jgi:hypothetical protein